MKTIVYHFRMPEELHRTVEERASIEGVPMAELIRRFIEKGLDVDGYKKETDFIRNILRQELEKIIEPFGNRIIKMLMKIGFLLKRCTSAMYLLRTSPSKQAAIGRLYTRSCGAA